VRKEQLDGGHIATGRRLEKGRYIGRHERTEAGSERCNPGIGFSLNRAGERIGKAAPIAAAETEGSRYQSGVEVENITGFEVGPEEAEGDAGVHREERR
jgi:hypothetical protein